MTPRTNRLVRWRARRGHDSSSSRGGWGTPEDAEVAAAFALCVGEGWAGLVVIGHAPDVAMPQTRLVDTMGLRATASTAQVAMSAVLCAGRLVMLGIGLDPATARRPVLVR